MHVKSSMILTETFIYIPVCIQPYGRWDLRQVVEQGYGADYVKYMVQLLEQGYALMEKDSKDRKTPLTQIILIYDLEGLSMRQIVSRESKFHTEW